MASKSKSKAKKKRCKLAKLLHSFSTGKQIKAGHDVYDHWLSWKSEKTPDCVYELYDCGHCPYYVSYGRISQDFSMPVVPLLYQTKPIDYCKTNATDEYVDFSTVSGLVDYIENDPDIIEEMNYQEEMKSQGIIPDNGFIYLHHYEITEEDQTTVEHYIETSKILYDKYGDNVYITKFDPKGWCITFA